MARRGGGQRKLKRVAAPKIYPISKRKGIVWVVKARAGPHKKTEAVPLGVILRDYLQVAHNLREVKKILHRRNIIVDGKVRTDYKYPVGLYDVISIPKMDKYYRVRINRLGRVVLDEISQEDAHFKPIRVENKTVVKGGKIQANLYDGKNILYDQCKVGDTLIVDLKEMKVTEVIKLEPGNDAMIASGRNRGKIGKILEIKEGSLKTRPMVKLLVGDKEVETLKEHIYPISDRFEPKGE